MVAMGDGWGQRSALGDGRGGCLPAIQLLHGCDLAGEHAALYAVCEADPASGHECDEGQRLHWPGEGDPGDEAAEAGAVMLILLLVALYIPSVLPDGLIKTMLSAQGATGLCIIMLLVLSFVYFDGKPAIDFVELAKKSIPWNMVCLLTAVGPLGDALMSSDTGFTKAIMATLKPIMAGQSPTMFYIFTIILACVLTQFMNNTILLVVMTPMFCTIAGMVGANPILVTSILIFGLTAALCTPGASSRAGLVFGNTEWIDVKQAYIQAVLSVVAVILVLAVIGIPLGSVLF